MDTIFSRRSEFIRDFRNIKLAFQNNPTYTYL